uniref:Ribosomal protein L36 n=3 Tax=Pinus subgen. Strobus TaxID=139272 RepID=A0A0S2IA99_PINSI|nr:ribosomal protein L36 [Pinus koraiensis]YP_009249770.1 ribosomal protein L36 [Pinus sibirica]AAO74070.1 ORF54c [Pinus koraiensis]ALO20507.1 ribosomal protein L36 [Pinus sibirica]QFS20717.1 ribosomal protein L36 [Pinus cembra]
MSRIRTNYHNSFPSTNWSTFSTNSTNRSTNFHVCDPPICSYYILFPETESLFHL